MSRLAVLLGGIVALALLGAGAGRAIDGGTLVKDIWPGDGWSRPELLTDAGGTLYLRAVDGSPQGHGSEPYISNGTEAGTTAIRVGSGNSEPWSFTPVGGQVFFGAATTAQGQLWVTDGTEAGTHLVKDVPPGGTNRLKEPYATLNGIVYFPGYDSGGWELWRSDGSDAGTYKVKEINPAPGNPGASGLYPPVAMGLYNGRLYFGANDGAPDEIRLWSTDGTAIGTVEVAAVTPSGAGFGVGYAVFANELYFLTQSAGLWKTNGTTLGTMQVPGSPDTVQELEVSGGKVFFRHENELWVTNGTTTALLHSFDDGAHPWQLTDGGGVLYFSAADYPGGRALWRSDGTVGGTVLVHDFEPGDPDSAGPDEFASLNGAAYFEAGDSTYGREPWRIDGAGNLVQLADVNPGPAASNPAEFTLSNGRIFFAADKPGVGRELFSVALMPTATSAVSLAARRSGGALTVRWRTRNELGTVGFNVYRSRGDGRVRANRSPIRANGTVAGRAYAFRDRLAPRRGRPLYWLEEVRAAGPSRWHGPTRAR